MKWLDLIVSLLRRPAPASKPVEPVEPVPVPTVPAPHPIDMEAWLRATVNAARAINRVPGLLTTPEATEAARFWSQYQARWDGMGHVGPPGYRDAGERLGHFGQAFGAEGEIVAQAPSPAEAVRLWLESPGEDPRGLTHRKILLGPDWTGMGAGWAVNPLSGRPYATVVFFR